jgi:hypothetical protein
MKEKKLQTGDEGRLYDPIFCWSFFLLLTKPVTGMIHV